MAEPREGGSPALFRSLGHLAEDGKSLSENVERWHPLPGAPRRNGVKDCSYKSHFDKGRVAGCPGAACSAPV